MTVAAINTFTCTCTEQMIATGDMCPVCDSYYCANCGEHPALEGGPCGACFDDSRQMSLNLEAGDLVDRDEEQHRAFTAR